MGPSCSMDQPFSFSVLQAFASPRVGRQTLDQDVHGRAVVEGDAGAVHEAQAGGRTGNLGHQGGLAAAHLAQAVAEALVTGQLANASGRSGRKLAELDALVEG